MKKYPSLAVITAACIWGCMGLFVRRVEAAGLKPMDIVAIRSLGAFLFLLCYMLLRKRTLFKIRIRDLPLFIGSGAVSIAFFNYCYFTTITRTSLSTAAVLLYTAPSFVIIFARLIFKETITLRKITALLMSFSGCILVSGVLSNSKPVNPSDLLIGLGAGIGYALYSIFCRSAIVKGYSTLTITLYTFLFAGLSTVPLTDITKMAENLTHTPDIWPYLLSMVLLVTIVAYGLYTYGLNHMDAGTASIMACIEPVVATLIGFLAYQESLTLSEILGITMVIFSTVLLNQAKYRKGVKQYQHNSILSNKR